MTALQRILVSIALSAAAVFLSILSLCAYELACLIRALPDRISTQIADTRGQILAQVANAQFQAMERLDRMELMADRQLTGARGDLLVEMRSIHNSVDNDAEGLLARVDAALAEVAALHAEARPILENAVAITAHANEATTILFARNALPAQLLGVLGGAKVTLGETAQTMRDIQRATPQLLAGADRVVQNSDKSTAATSRMLGNLADATRPLPKWMRVGLGVAPPLASVGASVATGLALTGAVGRK